MLVMVPLIIRKNPPLAIFGKYIPFSDAKISLGVRRGGKAKIFLIEIVGKKAPFFLPHVGVEGQIFGCNLSVVSPEFACASPRPTISLSVFGARIPLAPQILI